ncbi:MAG TPA: class I SAM-dependent methyltransferase [Candidatus Bathyarchaeia archaeon]|nr:class I SAM-dependent methyltransferase [Candidatus Bathyarchaeia archaeon]
MKVDLHGVEGTLLAPLWGRAKFSREYPSVFNDTKAVELVEQIDYDFSAIDEGLRFEGTLLLAARAMQFDGKVRAYIAEYPTPSVINVGAGLDTTFYRIDNGCIEWYDLDLPNVISVRRRLLSEPERTTYLAKSLFDASWCKDIEHTENGVFVICGGVLDWFEDSQVKLFLSLLADNFRGAEVVLNAQSRLGKFVANLGLRRTGTKKMATRWALKDARTMTKWDARIEVLDQFSALKNIPRDSAWSTQIERWMNLIDKSRMWNIFHLRV